MKRILLITLLSLLIGCGGVSAASQDSPQATPLAANEITLPEGNDVLALMQRSYSAHTFAEGMVPKEDIALLLQAGSRAPSAKNAQPWHFSVSTNHQLNTALLDAAQPGNVIIVISGNPDIVTDTLDFDCGLAAQNIQLAAESLGYGCRMYIAPLQTIEKSYRETLDVPKGYKVIIALLIGPVGDGVDAQTSATPRDSLADKVTMVS